MSKSEEVQRLCSAVKSVWKAGGQRRKGREVQRTLGLSEVLHGFSGTRQALVPDASKAQLPWGSGSTHRVLPTYSPYCLYQRESVSVTYNPKTLYQDPPVLLVRKPRTEGPTGPVLHR